MPLISLLSPRFPFIKRLLCLLCCLFSALITPACVIPPWESIVRAKLGSQRGVWGYRDSEKQKLYTTVYLKVPYAQPAFSAWAHTTTATPNDCEGFTKISTVMALIAPHSFPLHRWEALTIQIFFLKNTPMQEECHRMTEIGMEVSSCNPRNAKDADKPSEGFSFVGFRERAWPCWKVNVRLAASRTERK